jgi:hypothetical protein
LRLVDHRRVAVEVADIDREPHAIPEARPRTPRSI